MANRLAQETSPYLLQHKDNPVDWHPWGDEAFAKAKREDKPLLVSIGYSSCHWCHVMEHETFENPAIAKQMNEAIVSVKVDREERPEVDDIYMQAAQAMGTQGGWPLNVFVTPDGIPMFAGTYWPPHDTAGMPGFSRVVPAVAAAWSNNREAVVENAGKVQRYLHATAVASPDPGPVTEAVPTAALAKLREQFDVQDGGFGDAPKFPQASVLEFLIRHWRRTGSDDARAMLEKQLNGMASGGIYDHLGGGFARYSVDKQWLVPHFEKMLYDNAQLIQIYTDAWRMTGNPHYRAVVEHTADWVLREMRAPDGGFMSALDADSEGVEGKFYVWTAEEIDEALPAEQADVLKLHFGVTPEGNFEGKTVLSIVRSAADLAESTGQSVEAVAETLALAQSTLMRLREQRVRPGLDDKVIASWNGMMIGALADAGGALDRQDLLAAADRAAGFLLDNLRDNDGRLHRTWKAGETRGAGVLEDYSQVADGLLTLYRQTGMHRWLDAASELYDVVRAEFDHEGGPGFFDTGTAHETLIVRPRTLQDGAVPCGNSVMADVMLTLSQLRRDDDMAAETERILAMMVRPAPDHPLALGRFLAVMERWVGPRRELTYVGPDAEAVGALRAVVSGRFEPFTVVGYAKDDATDAAYPMMADRPLPESAAAAAYLCQHFTCLPPVTDAASLRDLLDSPPVPNVSTE